MTAFNPSWSDSFKFDSGSFSGGGSGGGSSFGSSWNPGSGGFSGIGSDSESWNKGFNLEGDPFGLNKDKEKKESPWGDVLRFAGNKLSDYAKNQSGQGGRSDGLAVGGGGGVSQSGDLTIVYPQAPTVIPGQKSGLGSAIGSIAGAALGSLIPGVGTALGAGLGGSVGGAFG
jgi:hypothetical protein